MSRHPISGTCRDTATGQVRGSSTVAVYLAGGTTPASIYAASSGGTAVNSVTSDSLGKFLFYIDETDYPLSQLFKIVTSKTGYDPVTYDNLPFFSFQCIDTDNTLSANSDKKLATQKAVKGYIDTRLPSTTSENDFLIGNNSSQWTKKTLSEAVTLLGANGLILNTLVDANTVIGGTADNTPIAMSITQVLDLVGSCVEGDILYRGASTWSRLAKGTANYNLFQNSGATAPEWARGHKIITSSHDISSTGNVDVTNFGFTPSLAFVIANIPDTATGSLGVDDGTTRFAWNNESLSVATYWYFTTNYSVYIVKSGSDAAYATLSMISDGVRFAWNKTGSPTGTVQLGIVGFR